MSTNGIILIDPRTITATVTMRARFAPNGWVTGDTLYGGGGDYTFSPRAAEGNVRVIDVTDARGKWEGVFVVVDGRDYAFARAADKLRKKDVAELVRRTLAMLTKTASPAGEARNSVLIDRKRGRL